MTLRRTLLGLVCAAAVVSGAPANPPLPEGREVDPVVRDFHLGEPPAAAESGTPAVAPDRPGEFFGWSLVVALHAAIMDRFTMQLGTVKVGDDR